MKKLLPLAAALLLTGCGAVKIGRILDEPARYQNRTVTVKGTVDRSFGALVTGVYEVGDGTGKIYVLSNGGPPRTGTSVSVKGRVVNGITVGPRSFGTTLREQSRHVHY
ncbi:MAG: hypothetical protein ACM336_20400 [Acidobacteriota bacterium]